MKKKILFVSNFLILTFTSSLFAQPSAVKNVAKSVFSLTTFRADGSILASSHGVFVGGEGEAVSDLKPFLGAATAVVVDAMGNKMNVTRMLGLNDIYDVARFRVDGKTTPAAVANVASTNGQDAWLITYGLKSPEIVATKVKSVEKFMDKYNYYIFGMNAPDHTTGCPYVNMYGQVIGLLQMSTTSFDTHACDVAFIRSLSVTGFSLNDPSFQQIGIPIALPSNEDQARLMLMMSSQSKDSLKYTATINDFIEMFPSSTDGYNHRALIEAAAQQWNNADETMKTCIKKANAKDEAHYNYGKMMYNYAVNGLHWSLDDALNEANAAYKENAAPLYQHLQAQIIFAKGDFQQSLNIFEQLSKDKSFSTPELLYEQAQCKRKLNAPNEEILALLDSAINTTDTLRFVETAPYFLTRAQVYDEMGKYRDAVFDYTRYEYLVQGRVNASFYYIREQAEVNGKLYQQALSDIARAIILAPQEPTYYAEMANLQLRVKKPEDAIKTAQRCTEIAPEYADGYLLLGLAQIQTKKKTEGLANLQKAKDMGSEQAQPLIDKYSK